MLKSEFGHVWSVTDNFGLFTKIAVCKFLRGWRSYGSKPFSFVHCMCLHIFLQLFVRGGALSCALDLAWDQCTIEMSIISSSIHGRTYS